MAATLYHTRLSLLFIGLFIALPLSGCVIDTSLEAPPSGNSAEAIIAARFLDGPNGVPITNTPVLILARYDNDNEFSSQGDPLITDEHGSFEGLIWSPNRVVIKEFIFEFLHDGEHYALRQDVDLELKYSEPIERVDLHFHINQE